VIQGHQQNNIQNTGWSSAAINPMYESSATWRVPCAELMKNFLQSRESGDPCTNTGVGKGKP